MEKREVIKAINKFLDPRSLRNFNSFDPTELRKSHVTLIFDMYNQVARENLSDERAREKVKEYMAVLEGNPEYLPKNIRAKTLAIWRVLRRHGDFQKLSFSGQRLFVAFLLKLAQEGSDGKQVKEGNTRNENRHSRTGNRKAGRR